MPVRSPTSAGSRPRFRPGRPAGGSRLPDPRAFIKNLRKVKGYDADGAFQPVDFKDSFGDRSTASYYVKVENGAFVPQFDGEPFCGDPA